MRYKVKRYMRDNVTGELRRPGQIVEMSPEAAKKLGNKVESAEAPASENAMMPKPNPAPRHVGGGWYEEPEGLAE